MWRDKDVARAAAPGRLGYSVLENSLDAQIATAKFVVPPGGEYVVGGSDSYDYPVKQRDDQGVMHLRRAIGRALEEAIAGGEEFWRTIEAAALGPDNAHISAVHDLAREDSPGTTEVVDLSERLIAELERSAKLHERGHLTDKEFSKLKKGLLKDAIGFDREDEMSLDAAWSGKKTKRPKSNKKKPLREHRT